jgi:hypothetical protein
VADGRTVTCPLDGTPLTLPTTESREDDAGIIVVVTDPGTVHAHIRDEHPAMWARLREARERMNASPFIGGTPRRVDGTLLLGGRDVGYTP